MGGWVAEGGKRWVGGRVAVGWSDGWRRWEGRRE